MCRVGTIRAREGSLKKREIKYIKCNNKKCLQVSTESHLCLLPLLLAFSITPAIVTTAGQVIGKARKLLCDIFGGAVHRKAEHIVSDNSHPH